MTREVRIKPLVWRDHEDGSPGEFADTMGAFYVIEIERDRVILWRAGDPSWSTFATVEEAKAFAQGDHNRRVRWLLEP